MNTLLLCLLFLWMVIVGKPKTENNLTIMSRGLRKTRAEKTLWSVVAAVTGVYTLANLLAQALNGWTNPISPLSLTLYTCALGAAIRSARLAQKEHWTKTHIEEEQRNRSVVCINFENLDTIVWLRPTGENWPPCQLEISIEGEIHGVEELSQEAKDEIGDLLEKSDILSDKQIRKQILERLKSIETTHIIDIAGSQNNGRIQAILEGLLQKESQAPLTGEASA